MSLPGFCSVPREGAELIMHLAATIRAQVVISPHVYPPTITTAVTGYAGTSLFNRLTVAHGYLTKQVSLSAVLFPCHHSL